MKPLYYLSFCFLLFLLTMGDYTKLMGQNEGFAERLIIGSSLTYIPTSLSQISEPVYHEFSWTNNIAVNINSYAYFGIEYINLFTKGNAYYQSEEKNNYYLVGAFTQVDLLDLTARRTSLKENKARLLVELAYYYGNYCECGYNTSPYKVEGLNYLGFGIGGDFPILNWLSLDVTFKSNSILKDIPEKFGYNYYILGLNIDIIRKK